MYYSILGLHQCWVFSLFTITWKVLNSCNKIDWLKIAFIYSLKTLTMFDIQTLYSIGRPKHVRVMAGALEGDLFVGPKAEEHRGLLSIRYPMEHGVVTDWNDMERIWNYIYSNDQLQTFSEEHPVLLTEAPLNPRRNREKAAEIFFESFNVPALYVSMQAVLSLWVSVMLVLYV